MVVRCGRCRAELEIPGPGEFLCPACGTRNVVRGAGAAGGNALRAQGASGLTLPGGMPAPPASRPSGPQPGVDWMSCPACTYRFAIGMVEKVICPNCGAHVERPEDAPLPPP